MWLHVRRQRFLVKLICTYRHTRISIYVPTEHDGNASSVLLFPISTGPNIPKHVLIY